MIGLGLLAFVGYQVVTNVIMIRNHSLWKACAAGNLRPMSAELAKFAKEKGRPPTSLTDIVGPGKTFSTLPVCPAGGTYSLVVEKEDGPAPSCSVHGTLSHPANVNDGHNGD